MKLLVDTGNNNVTKLNEDSLDHGKHNSDQYDHPPTSAAGLINYLPNTIISEGRLEFDS